MIDRRSFLAGSLAVPATAAFAAPASVAAGQDNVRVVVVQRPPEICHARVVAVVALRDPVTLDEVRDLVEPRAWAPRQLVVVEEIPLALLWTWVEQRRIEDLKSLTLILALRVRRPELF